MKKQIVCVTGAGGFLASWIINLLLSREGQKTIEDRTLTIVDVHDASEALILAYEKPEAGGRYLCIAHAVKQKEVVDLASSLIRISISLRVIMIPNKVFKRFAQSAQASKKSKDRTFGDKF